MTSRIFVFGFVLGALGLAAGCGGTGKPVTIVYEKTETIEPESSGKDAIAPQEVPTRSAGDEVILPQAPSTPSAISDFASAPVTPPATPAPAPSEVSPVPDPGSGDGVVSETPDIGAPPLPAPLSCDTKNFAFVSKRGGASNVFVQRDQNISKLTANDTGLRNYSRLEVRKGGQDFATDEITLLILFPVIRSAFGSLERPEALTSLPAERSFTRGFSWNHEGTKAAYLRMTPERGDLSTAIHYVTNLETMETQRDMVVDPHGDYRVGQIAWWGNRLVVDFNFDSGAKISVIDPERFPLNVQSVALVDSESVALDAPHLEGSQPAVSKNGQLAFVRMLEDGRSAIATCTLQDVPTAAELKRQCAGLRIFDAAGNNDSPAFSPDGRWIYFVSDRDGNREIYRMHVDGTGSERLTNDPAVDESPAPLLGGDGCE